VSAENAAQKFSYSEEALTQKYDEFIPATCFKSICHRLDVVGLGKIVSSW